MGVTPITLLLGAGPSNQPQLLLSQRPTMPQQRPPNGAPFSSPTMAHSPQTTGTAPGPQQTQAGGMNGPMGTSQPLNQMGRGMLPPNGPQSMAAAVPMGGPHQTPQPAFQPLGPSPNQPGSPSQNLTAPSPSMVARQPPGLQQQQQHQQQIQEQVLKDLGRLGQDMLNQIKTELGLGGKDDLSMTLEEKVHFSFPVVLRKLMPSFKSRIVGLARSRGRLSTGPNLNSNLNKPLSQGPPNAAAGPSGMNMQNQSQRPLGMGPQQSLQPQSQIAAQQRSIKRNSTSPGEDVRVNTTIMHFRFSPVMRI